MTMKSTIEVQRSKVNENKWERVKFEEYPESIEDYKMIVKALKKYAKYRAADSPNYEYRVVEVEELKRLD